MRKLRLVSLMFALTLSALAFVKTPPAHAYPTFYCEIDCWQAGTQWCMQDGSCHVTCCDIDDPSCSCPF